MVSLALPTDLQTPVTKFCLEQRSHGGPDRHVWAMDFMQLLPVLPGTHTHLAQFSINLGCGSYQPANRCDTFHPQSRSEVGCQRAEMTFVLIFLFPEV